MMARRRTVISDRTPPLCSATARSSSPESRGSPRRRATPREAGHAPASGPRSRSGEGTPSRRSSGSPRPSASRPAGLRIRRSRTPRPSRPWCRCRATARGSGSTLRRAARSGCRGSEAATKRAMGHAACWPGGSAVRTREVRFGWHRLCHDSLLGLHGHSRPHGRTRKSRAPTCNDDGGGDRVHAASSRRDPDSSRTTVICWSNTSASLSSWLTRTIARCSVRDRSTSATWAIPVASR